MPRDTLSTGTSFGESIVRHSQASRGSLTTSLIDDRTTAGASAIAAAQPLDPPDMWSWPYAALYAHYCCIGVVNGLLGQALLPYCLYVAHGEPNTCVSPHTHCTLFFWPAPTSHTTIILGRARARAAACDGRQVRDRLDIRQPTVGIQAALRPARRLRAHLRPPSQAVYIMIPLDGAFALISRLACTCPLCPLLLSRPVHAHVCILLISHACTHACHTAAAT